MKCGIMPCLVCTPACVLIYTKQGEEALFFHALTLKWQLSRGLRSICFASAKNLSSATLISKGGTPCCKSDGAGGTAGGTGAGAAFLIQSKKAFALPHWVLNTYTSIQGPRHAKHLRNICL